MVTPEAPPKRLSTSPSVQFVLRSSAAVSRVIFTVDTVSARAHAAHKAVSRIMIRHAVRSFPENFFISFPSPYHFFTILKVLVMMPVKLPFPVTITFAVPAFTLFTYFTV